MLPIKSRNIPKNKIMENNHAAYNIWAHDLHLIKNLERYSDDPEMVKFNVKKRENEDLS